MKISGVGCCLIDTLYPDIDYRQDFFRNLLSRSAGDGGLVIGGLTFFEDFIEYGEVESLNLLNEFLKYGQKVESLGGPAVISVLHASQLLHDEDIEFNFFNALGDDETGKKIRNLLARTSLNPTFKTCKGVPSPGTLVLSDPRWDSGSGERTFINTLGAANHVTAADIPESIFASDILLLGGTALVPGIHADLSEILAKAKESGAFTIVGTVYDFWNQKRHPEKPWPLGRSRDLSPIDLLVCDREEALRITGKSSADDACAYLQDSGVHAFLVTGGTEETLCWSKGDLFKEVGSFRLPASDYIRKIHRTNPALYKDTTGCGDNFLGGALASLALQLEKSRRERASLRECGVMGTVSGGFATLHYGGPYWERSPGEKQQRLQSILDDYRRQILQ